MSGETIGDAYLNIFSLFIRSHNLYNKVGNVCRNGLLGDVLDERAKLHWQTFFALQVSCKSVTHGSTTIIAAHLFLSDERTPEHADALADHGDVELVLLLEPRDDLLEGRIVLEHEAIPQRPLRRPVLVCLGRYRLRETEERQREVHKPVFVVVEFILAVDDLMGETMGP